MGEREEPTPFFSLGRLGRHDWPSVTNVRRKRQEKLHKRKVKQSNSEVKRADVITGCFTTSHGARQPSKWDGSLHGTPSWLLLAAGLRLFQLHFSWTSF